MSRSAGRRTSRITQVLVLMGLHATLCAAAFGAPGWTLTPLTNNTYINESPDISGTNVVWHSYWDEAYLDRRTAISSNFAGELANGGGNAVVVYQPAISGTNVVWSQRQERQYVISSNFAGQVSGNAGLNDGHILPDISGSNVAWWTYHNNINGGFVYGEVYLNGVLLTDGTAATGGIYAGMGGLAVSGTNVVWTGYDGANWQVYSNFAGQLTHDAVNHEAPAISGTNVVWQGWDGTDWEIFSNFAGQLTDNDVDDGSPDISGTNVVWQRPGWPGLWTNFGGQVPMPDPYVSGCDPAISGTNIAFVYNLQIYMATYGEPVPVPGPGAILLGILGLPIALRLRRCARQSRP